MSNIGNTAGHHDAAGFLALATTQQRLLTLLFGKQPVNSTHRHIINHVPCPSDKATTKVPSAYALLLTVRGSPVGRQSLGCWAQLATALPALLLARRGYKETLAVACKPLTRLALILDCTTRGSSDGGCARQPATGEAEAEAAMVVVAVPGGPVATNIQQSSC